MKTQTDAVAEAMRQNGGYATLRHLYEHALRIEGVRWRTKTPFASIRRIVQISGLFFKIRPGLWALNEYRTRLPADVQAMMANPDDESGRGAELSHYYYQGLVLELGHLRGFRTYVPAQDGGRISVGRPLRDIADTTDIPHFTYDRVLGTVRMIDVIWFNLRGYPHSAFEIEHTTDFRGAFEKFTELSDFRVDMVVVAHPVRRRQFDAVFSRSMYEPLRSRVRFINYEQLARLHSSTQAMAAAEREAGIAQ